MAYSHGYVKRNFFTGQYDREFSGQENAITNAGMVYCKNVLTSPQGECKTRPGTEFLSNIDGESVVIPYRRAGKDLALVFSDSHLNVKTFDDASNLIDFVPATLSSVVWTNTSNNEPASTAVDITNNVSGDLSLAYRFWSWSVYDLTSGYSTNRLYVPQQTYPTTFFNMRFVDGKALNTLSLEIIQADGNWSATYLQKVKNWIKDAYLQYTDDEGANWHTVRLTRPVYWGNKTESTVAGERPIPRLRFDLLETSSHVLWRVVIVWNRQQMLNNAPFLAHFTDVKEETAGSVQTFNTPYTTDQLKKLKYSQNYNQLIICDGIHNPYQFSMVGNTPSWLEKTYDFMTNDGVPSCVRFFQNRLYYGGFAAYPNRVRASRFGDETYSDFTVETQGATVASPINVECNQFTERITDLWGGFNVLYAQSSEGVAFVTGMSSTPNFTLQCSERASGITPTMKDNIMYYVGYDRRKIHAFSYDLRIEQFVAPDITRCWQEVLKNRVSEIHYVDSRSKCIVGGLEDGTGFFLFHEGNDIGFFPFDINGFISDISVLKDGDDSHVLFTVNRGTVWTIERLHMPEFMRVTNAFEQTGKERNIATQENLLKSPFFDSWKIVKNEYIQPWKYNAIDKTIEPLMTGNPVDLKNYVGKYIRCYYGDGIRDYTDVKINRVFMEQHTEEREIEVIETVTYYGWQYAGAINVTPKAGVSPAVSGRWVRDTNQETVGVNLAFAQNNNVIRTRGKTVVHVGDTMYRSSTQVAFVESIEQSVIFTKTQIPSSGDPVYDYNYNQIGTVSTMANNGIIFNNLPHYNDPTLTRSHTETHTETIIVVIDAGSYDVECDLTEDTAFNKIQLPIEKIETSYSKIQVQDNGVYKGTFDGETHIEKLYEWKYNNNSIYTKSTNPEQNDEVYDVAGNVLGLVENIIVGENKIVFNQHQYTLQTISQQVTHEVNLYGWATVSIASSDPISGDAYIGTRNPNSDVAESSYPGGPLYAWLSDPFVGSTSGDVYTTTPNPEVGDQLYIVNIVPGAEDFIEFGTVESLVLQNCYTKHSQGWAGQQKILTNGTVTNIYSESGNENSIDFQGVTYNRNSTIDTRMTITETESVASFVVVEMQGVIFTEPMYNIQWGIPYRKIGVIEDNRSYLRQKGWGAIAFNIIDTMSLKVGIKLDKLTNMIKWNGNQFFNSNLIMKNGTLICNIKDVPQYEKQLIFMTDEGLPFTVLAIETEGDISDRGAN